METIDTLFKAIADHTEYDCEITCSKRKKIIYEYKVIIFRIGAYVNEAEDENLEDLLSKTLDIIMVDTKKQNSTTNI